MWHVFAAECAGCGKRWLPVVDGDITFGLECPRCHEPRGRKVSPRMPCETMDDALRLATRVAVEGLDDTDDSG